MSAVSVRTPGAHKHHVKKPTTTCGCATKENTTKDTPTSRCPCGALYLRDVVTKLIGFTCYDCQRAVNVWVSLRALPRLD